MREKNRIITANQSKALDIRAREVFGISTAVLMENAGRSVAEEALKITGKKTKMAIFCGKGNNGGDGFVAAGHFLTKGIEPDIFLAGRSSEVKNEARVNLEVLLRLKQKIFEVSEKNLHLVRQKIPVYNLIIDALLGAGLQGQVRVIMKGLICAINSSKAYVLSVDIPSGLDAASGGVLGCSIKADKTVTFIAKKRGMAIGEGVKHCGEIVTKDLGIPL